MISGGLVVASHFYGPAHSRKEKEKNLEIVGGTLVYTSLNTEEVVVALNSGTELFREEAGALRGYLEEFCLPAEIRAVDMGGLYERVFSELGLSTRQFGFNGGANIAVARMVGTNLIGAGEGYVLVLDDGMTPSPHLRERLSGALGEGLPEILVFTSLVGVQDEMMRGTHYFEMHPRKEEQCAGEDRWWRRARPVRLVRHRGRFIGGRHLARISEGYCTEFQIPLHEDEDVQIYGERKALSGEWLLSSNPTRRRVDGKDPWKVASVEYDLLGVLAGEAGAFAGEYGGFREFVRGFAEGVEEVAGAENYIREIKRRIMRHHSGDSRAKRFIRSWSLERRLAKLAPFSKREHLRNYAAFLGRYFDVLEFAREVEQDYSLPVYGRHS